MKYIVMLFLLVILVSSCSSKKTQQEEYEDMTSGLTYNTYKSVSSGSVGPAVTAYNKQKPDTVAPLDVMTTHLMLGYLWAVSSKPSMAFAEAAIVEEGDEEGIKFLAKSLRSVTMYEQGWDSLAKQESERASQSMKSLSPEEVHYEMTVYYLLMGTMYAYGKDFKQSKFFFAGFANETGIQWPYKVIDAAADFQNGKTQEGLIKIKAMSQDESIPEPMRKVFAEEIAKIEKNIGTDVNSSFFWPKLISRYVFEELKKSSNTQISHYVKVLEHITSKLPV
jgi:outer membrane protein assembly factor BamD (BamD/ComL family)